MPRASFPGSVLPDRTGKAAPPHEGSGPRPRPAGTAGRINGF
ncbi:hypothetical protein NY78_2460 [Desulfovibrio sp. TomC]|nr:hypothetical protein NY78_2460 [Desulfovibrio sp. TomC]